jgi:uncharacterized protein YndB with AHSA1/START domain
MPTTHDERGEVTQGDGRAELRIRRRLAATPASVWRALTDPAELERWLAVSAELELRLGGRVELQLGGDTAVGEILRFDPPAQLAFSWHESSGAFSSRVDIRLSPDGDGTWLELRHAFTGPANAYGFAAGWHHKLELLADALEGRRPAWRDARFEELLAAYAQTSP